MTKTSAGVISLISILLLFQAQCLKLPNSGLEHDGVTVCYVSTWAVYRPGDGKFGIDDLDPSLCTHLVYAFAGLNETSDTIRSLDPFNDLEEEYGKGTYKKMASLKSRYPHLKVTLAIGGWNEGSEKYSTLAASPTRRKTFVESVVQFLKKFGFDGFDLDWEYPAKRGGVPEDKHNFVSLVKELKAEMVKNGWILTAAVGAGKDTIDAAYDLPSLSDHLDYIHLMCYDYHGAWDLKVGANAPIRSNDKNDVLTVEYSVKYLLQNGVSPKKLVLGVPFYGRTFVLKNPDSKSNETENKGFQGPFTREDGFLGYNEICNELKENSSSWHQWFDEETKSMYASNNEKVIAFDNARSIKEKVKLAAYNELAGVMVWSIDTDDFRGTCKEAEGSNPMTFPLLRSINRALAESIEEVQNEIRNKKENTKNKNPNSGSRGEISIFATTFVFLSIIVSTYRYS